MKSISIVIFFFFSASLVNAQQRRLRGHIISGTITGKTNVINDTVIFQAGKIEQKYFDPSFLKAKIIENKFRLVNKTVYPQMWSMNFASDKGIRPWRNGSYFIDPLTTKIGIFYDSGECNEVNGKTAEEYNKRFIPFVTKSTKYQCDSSYMTVVFSDPDRKIDTLLHQYVLSYPGSYVGLWKLVERFATQGHSLIRQQTLQAFSTQIKRTPTWKMLNEDFKQEKIKEGERFPAVDLKDLNLAATHLNFNNAKYTLIDFWFARCRPCLDTIPALKILYAKYHSRNFNILSISVDETANVPIWQRRVKEHELNWPQYLQENNFRKNELGVTIYPTFILLNEAGVVIWKAFDLHELDKFLEKRI